MIGEDQQAAYMPRSTAAFDVMHRASLVAAGVVVVLMSAIGGYSLYREIASGYFDLKTWIASNWVMTGLYINCIVSFWRSAPKWLAGLLVSGFVVCAVAVLLWDVEPTFDAYSGMARQHWGLFAMAGAVLVVCVIRLCLFLRPAKSLTA